METNQEENEKQFIEKLEQLCISSQERIFNIWLTFGKNVVDGSRPKMKGIWDGNEYKTTIYDNNMETEELTQEDKNSIDYWIKERRRVDNLEHLEDKLRDQKPEVWYLIEEIQRKEKEIEYCYKSLDGIISKYDF